MRLGDRRLVLYHGVSATFAIAETPTPYRSWAAYTTPIVAPHNWSRVADVRRTRAVAGTGVHCGIGRPPAALPLVDRSPGPEEEFQFQENSEPREAPLY